MALAHVVTATGQCSVGTTTATTGGVDTTGANLLIAVVSWSGSTAPTVSDSVGGNANSWSALQKQESSGVGNDILILWTTPTRSEERRVGKECRSRWSP